MKKQVLSSMLLGMALALGCAAPAMADSRKVVTLGADLTQDQQNTMMRYFGVSSDSVDIIYINNNDEREHLGSYVPLEQIGTKTFSCALVAPTSTGGVQVKTANLSWVTCNMIASTLSTSGVTNCQVVAASPFEVSGTGALTGVMMAYENASQVTLDPVKKELANEELVTTGKLADEVGQSKATAVINETKIQVIENNITDITEITNVVNNVSNEYNVDISSDQSQEIAELMQKVAEQEYDIVQLKATLERVQANVAGDAGASEEQQAAAEEAAQKAEAEAAAAQPESETTDQVISIEGQEPTTEQTESILDNTDLSALEEGGVPASEGTTTQTVQEQEEEAATETTANILGIPEATSDGTVQQTESAVSGGQEAETAAIEGQTEAASEAGEAPAEPTEALTEAAAAEPEITEADLAEEEKQIYDKVKEELPKAFENNQVTEGDSIVYVTEDAAKKVPEEVEKYLLQVLVKGSDEVAMKEAADTEIPQNIMEDTKEAAPDAMYTDSDLKQMDLYVRRLVLKDSEKLLEDCGLEENDAVVIYNKVMDVLKAAIDPEEAETEETPVTEVPDVQEFTPEEAEKNPGEGETGSADEFADFEEETGSF